ncbi:hypothetical protein [Acidovorax anthurii]|uniref:hypothetical protein n=1 Tax=Paracidovorax anthurii TaxID=78229 RepID=UPI001473CE73
MQKNTQTQKSATRMIRSPHVSRMTQAVIVVAACNRSFKKQKRPAGRRVRRVATPPGEATQ